MEKWPEYVIPFLTKSGMNIGSGVFENVLHGMTVLSSILASTHLMRKHSNLAGMLCDRYVIFTVGRPGLVNRILDISTVQVTVFLKHSNKHELLSHHGVTSFACTGFAALNSPLLMRNRACINTPQRTHREQTYELITIFCRSDDKIPY